MPVSPALKKAQDKYRQNLKDKGLKRVSVWVPEGSYVKELTDIAKDMRDEYFEQQRNNGV